MGLGKWIVGGIVAAVAAPFVLPAAAVTAVGGAVAAGVGAVTAGAAAVGGAIAGLGASALAAASAIGAMLEDERTKGEKDGYRKASREFEAKLRSQAKSSLHRLQDLRTK